MCPLYKIDYCITYILTFYMQGLVSQSYFGKPFATFDIQCVHKTTFDIPGLPLLKPRRQARKIITKI